MRATNSQQEYVNKSKLLFGRLREGVLGPLKFIVAYVLIYGLLRLAEYGLTQLLIAGNSTQSTIQYIIFLAAVITGLAAQLALDLGIIAAGLSIIMLTIFLLKSAASWQYRQYTQAKNVSPQQTEPIPSYPNRSVVTFGEKIVRAHSSKPKRQKKTPGR